jgi:hypothetical protein
VNNESEKMWKEVVVVEFEVLPGNLSGGTEEDQEETQVECTVFGKRM